MNFSTPTLWFPFLVGGGLLVVSIWLTFKAAFYRRLWSGCTLLLSSGLLSLATGEIYTRVDQDGHILEAGLALPLGALLFLSGMACMIVLGTWHVLHLKRNRV